MGSVVGRFWKGERSVSEDGGEERPSPGAVHYSTVEPIDAGDFFELGAHGVTAVAGALPVVLLVFHICTGRQV